MSAYPLSYTVYHLPLPCIVYRLPSAVYRLLSTVYRGTMQRQWCCGGSDGGGSSDAVVVNQSPTHQLSQSPVQTLGVLELIEKTEKTRNLLLMLILMLIYDSPRRIRLKLQVQKCRLCALLSSPLLFSSLFSPPCDSIGFTHTVFPKADIPRSTSSHHTHVPQHSSA